MNVKEQEPPPWVGGPPDATPGPMPPILPDYEAIGREWAARQTPTDDYDDDALAMGRWRAQVASATRGKRGQAFFRDLLVALDAMPEKRLVPDVLEEGDEVCGLGALGRARGIDLKGIDPEEHEQLGSIFNVAHQLIQEVEWQNDSIDRVYSDGKWARQIRPPVRLQEPIA